MSLEDVKQTQIAKTERLTESLENMKAITGSKIATMVLDLERKEHQYQMIMSMKKIADLSTIDHPETFDAIAQACREAIFGETASSHTETK